MLDLMTRTAWATGVTAILFAAACAKPSGPAPDLATDCILLAGSSEAASTVSVALLDEVDPRHAPYPRNAGERLLFRHLYQTTLRVDCRGRAYAGLARSWRSEQDGRRWVLTLGEHARYWDGTSVTAHDIALSWLSREGAHGSQISAPWIGPDAVRVESANVLAIELDRAHHRVPALLAHPGLAPVGPSSGSSWPPGAGPYRIEAATGSVVTAKPLGDGPGPTISFRLVPGADARDLLDAGIDLLVTDDPAVLEYAAASPSLERVPLPWDRTYALAVPALAEARGGEDAAREEGSGFTPDFRDALARDAVRADARGYRSPSWWEDLNTCTPGDSVAGEAPGGLRSRSQLSEGRRIVYTRGDPTARDLADRLVALSKSPSLASAIPGYAEGGARLSAVGLDPADFDRELREGSDFAYIVALPRRALAPCRQARALTDQVAWLVSSDLRFSQALLPLVDTRQHVIARVGRVALSLDWDGTPLITAPAGQGRGRRGRRSP